MKRKDFLTLAGAAAAGSLIAPVPLVSDAWASAEGKTRLTVKIYELKLRQAWGLSRGTWTTRRNAFVRLERDGVTGLGEAAPIARYPHQGHCQPCACNPKKPYPKKWIQSPLITPN